MTRSDDAEPLLRLTGVTKRYGGAAALVDVDWDVRAGEVHCLVGENGSGKSTVIKVISGVVAPTSGTVSIGGQPIAQLTPMQAKEFGIQVIFQDLSLFPNLTVAENIAIDQRLDGYLGLARHSPATKLAESILGRLGFDLDPRALVGDLSSSQRQIVAICRGLAGSAKIIFMDEPTASLTKFEVDHLLAIVEKLKAQDIAVVFVSHRLMEVMKVAERVTVMRDGKRVGTWPAREMTQGRIASLMTGEDIDHGTGGRDMSDAPPLLEVEKLTRPGEFHDISFTVRRGEVVGITGLLGSGRTELAMSLFGMTRARSGTIRLDGKAVPAGSNRGAMKSGIAYVSEDRLNLGVILNQPIGDNVIVATMGKLRNRFGLMSKRRRRGLAADWVNRLAIKIPGLESAVQTLSGGNQQRVAIAKWLARGPRLLILDSPTIGVDIKNKQGIYDIVAALAKQGVGILMISDEVSEVFATCDRVLHMRGGRIVDAVVPGNISVEEMERRIYV